MEEREQFLREDPNMAVARALVIPDVEREQRMSEVNNALASVRMEGLEPDERVLYLYQRYVTGELTSEALDEALNRHLVAEYGPLPIPRN